MAIIKCIKCGEEFNDKDNVCPNCACLIKCSLKKDNNKINDEESQDKKYDVTINIVHSIRTNMLLKMFIKRNKFKENVSLFGKDESGFNRYYSKGKYFNYKIDKVADFEKKIYGMNDIEFVYLGEGQKIYL